MWAFRQNKSPGWLIISVVITVLVPLTHGQAYHFIIGHHQRNFDQLYREPNSRTNNVADTNNTDTATVDLDNSNSTIIVATVSEANELSQTAMDIITIVWYVATFLALAAFFLLMACSDRRCNDGQRNVNASTQEAAIPPPTPSPSYSEFAPPSYDSIFVVPFAVDRNAAKDVMNINGNNTTTNGQLLTPTISLYAINELQKLGS